MVILLYAFTVIYALLLPADLYNIATLRDTVVYQFAGKTSASIAVQSK